MTSRLSIAAAIATLAASVACQDTPDAAAVPTPVIDRDLIDVTVPRLRQLYADKKYTVTQVVRWHLDRIDRYNGVYGAIETLFRKDALDEASKQDADAGNSAGHGALWGVPIVIK